MRKLDISSVKTKALVARGVGLACPGAAASSRLRPRLSRRRRPVFRAGANYVRVDAYPTLGGELIRGLTKDDFEIFEDGKPQTVAAAELVTFGEPDDARGSMLSAREGLELASDPHYRVVIFVIDRALFDLPRWQVMREDLQDFLESQAGPRDLVGLITTDRPWTDLVLGRRIQSIVDEINEPEWLRAEPQEQTAVLNGCGLDGLQMRIRADETYGLLENIIKLLGAGARRSHQPRVRLGRPGPHAAGLPLEPSRSRCRRCCRPRWAS